MIHARHEAVRLAELKEMLAAYRHMTIEEAEATDAGDRQTELEQEVWLLEQERYSRKPAVRAA
jgi:hypothetical protein